MSKDYQKPVENGELREQIADIFDDLCEPTNQFWHRESGLHYADKVLALIAQEKAKWVAEVVSVIPKERNTDVGDAYQRTFCGEYNKALKEVRQALAKLLDKKGGENE